MQPYIYRSCFITVSYTHLQKTYDRGVYESDRSYNYQKDRDKVSDSQWAQEFALQKKSVAGRSGGGSGGGNGYLGSRVGSGSDGEINSSSYDISKIIAQGIAATSNAAKNTKIKKKK